MTTAEKIYVFIWMIFMLSFIALFIYTIKEIMEEDEKNEK